MKILKNVKIGTKILLMMLLTALTTLLLIFIISYSQMLNLTKYSENANILLGSTASVESENALIDQAKTYLSKISIEQAEKNNAILTQVEAELLSAKDYIESVFANPDKFVPKALPRPDQTKEGVPCAKAFLTQKETMSAQVSSEMRILSCVDYGVGAIQKNDSLVLDNVYLGTKSGISYRFSKHSNYDPSYDPRQRGWYKAAMEKPGELVWIDTYYDAFDGTIMVTCAITFTGADRKTIKGVIATDITVNSIKDNILNTRIGKEGFAFLLDADGKYIAHPDIHKEGFNNDPCDGASEDMLLFIENTKKNLQGVDEVFYEGEKSYIAYSPLDATKWTLAVTIPVDEVKQPAIDTRNKIDKYSDKTRVYIENSLINALIRFIILFAVCTILFVMFAFILSGTITKPIKLLVENVKKIGDGNLDSKIPVETRDEVGDLALAFNGMTDRLNTYISDLTRVTAEKERIGTELNVATTIQASMLPSIFPPFPNDNEYDLYATMSPAKEVGGDFYDFFMIDENRIALVMADVSGKGVPAALFMVIAKTLIKNRAIMGGSPSEILEYVNKQLCEGNKAEMFVTCWLGIYDIRTGHVVAANAGHEYPVVKTADGKFENFKDKHGFVLGGIEFSKYHDYEFDIETGGVLFLHTDGIPEAINDKKEAFGDERMLEALNIAPNGGVKEILANVRAAVDNFANSEPQFDDITMLIIRRMK